MQDALQWPLPKINLIEIIKRAVQVLMVSASPKPDIGTFFDALLTETVKIRDADRNARSPRLKKSIWVSSLH